MKTFDIARIAVFTALLCAVAPFALPIGPVPISLATLMIYICAGVLGRRRATLSVAVYILLGIVGLPIFTGFAGGVQKIVGATGGYIVGYIPLAYIAGAFADLSRSRNQYWLMPVGMVVGTVVLYACGTAWFVYLSGRTLVDSLALCVFPFLIGDASKIFVAAALSPVIVRRVSTTSA